MTKLFSAVALLLVHSLPVIVQGTFALNTCTCGATHAAVLSGRGREQRPLPRQHPARRTWYRDGVRHSFAAGIGFLPTHSQTG